MLRLRQLLQQSNLHQGHADDSYYPETLQYLWHLADEHQDGGVSDMSAPADAWDLDVILALTGSSYDGACVTDNS